ncbi:unnamed protein product [Dibothriocephalus latus]|uniref:Ankyrin repeat domain-containing protein n=1 Tax=Dibothriocephalus latus TaxID=60516 RepID=A0A3P7P299_DIBLA|nr:unnamed protein product [Dibothriocephalus latus]
MGIQLMEKKDNNFPLHYSIYNGLDTVETIGKSTPEQLDAQDQYVTKAFVSYRDQILKEGTSEKISDKLMNISDCVLDFHWELKSWVPFLSRFLPSDVCKLWKKGNKVRMDTSLLDFNNRNWVRGKLSILLDGNKPFDQRICILDHEKRCYEIMDGIMAKTDDNWLEQTIDMATRNELVHMNVETERMNYKTQSSKLVWDKNPVKERVSYF